MVEDTSYKTKSEHDPKLLARIARQVTNEFDAGERHVLNRREQWRTYLKLYLNQRKSPKTVGDTLMFSTHQTILVVVQAATAVDGKSP